MNIEKLLSDILKAEGGYVNDKRDAGGETNFGITIGTAKANGYTGPMKDLTKEQALGIYRNIYFFTPGFDKVMGVSAAVAAELFDTGVNMGPVIAAKFYQRSLNALNNEAKAYPDVAVDGNIGPKTIAAHRALVALRGAENAELVLLKALNCLQGERYLSLAETRPANEAFLYGWLMNRVELS